MIKLKATQYSRKTKEVISVFEHTFDSEEKALKYVLDTHNATNLYEATYIAIDMEIE